MKCVSSWLLVVLSSAMMVVVVVRCDTTSLQTANSVASPLTHINILVLLPSNNSYKYSMPKVLASLRMAIGDLRHTSFGSRFTIDLIPDSCDCKGIKAPVNAMENIFGIRNHTKKFQAVFGPMCD
jgi:hypothetical protein